MRKILIVALLSIFYTSTISACSCYKNSTIPYPNVFTFNGYNTIALVKVISSDSCFKSKVEILETFKGNINEGAQITIYNEHTKERLCNTSCDYSFHSNKTYVVFLDKTGESFVNLGFCSETHLIDLSSNSDELFLLRYLKDFKIDSNKYINLKDSSGNSLYQGFIKNNQPDLNWTIYENGVIKKKGTFENGKEEGVWVIYDLKNETHFKGVYSKGTKIGIWKKYDKNNNVIKTYHAEEGDPLLSY